MVKVGVDPGVDGDCIAVKLCKSEGRLEWWPITKRSYPGEVIVEDVSVSNNSTLLIDYGKWLGRLEGSDFRLATPFQWQQGLTLPDGHIHYKARKKRLFEHAKTLGYTGNKPGADAFMIACYGIRVSLGISWLEFLQRYNTKEG